MKKNARCVSIGLVLALSNCSESGGDPDAMLEIHNTGPASIDTHHQQFHNSYGNIKINHLSYDLSFIHYSSLLFHIFFSADAKLLYPCIYLTLNILCTDGTKSCISANFTNRLYRSQSRIFN